MIRQIEDDFIDKRVCSIVTNIINDAPKTGLPIGNYLSQFFANRYLTPFDFWLGDKADFVRYMDDIVVFGRSAEELHKLFQEIEWKLSRDFYLSIKPDWQIFRIDNRGIDFAGYVVRKNSTRIRKCIFDKMTDTLGTYEEILEETGVFTDHMRGSVMSYLGWVCACTECTRKSIYRNYFSRIIESAGIPLTTNMKKKFLSDAQGTPYEKTSALCRR